MAEYRGYRPSVGSTPSVPSRRYIARAATPEARDLEPAAEAAAGPKIPRDLLQRAAYITLSHVRGGKLPRDVAELLQDDPSRSEVIYRVGQMLGPLGLQGAKLEDAHEMLAQLPSTVEAILATDDSRQ